MGLYSEDLYSLRGAVQDVRSNAPKTSVDRWINRAIRDICRKHYWSDLKRMGTLSIPEAYSTGTITLNPGSKTVEGVSTSWPVSDQVLAAILEPVNYPGMTEFKLTVGTAAQLANIQAGTYLTLDSETPASMEVIAVEEVTTESFWAECKFTHAAGVSLVQSSLASRQLLPGVGAFTIKTVIDDHTLVLESPWGGVVETGRSYHIVQAFITIEQYAIRLMSANDPVQGYALNVDDYTYDDVLRKDPQFNSSGDLELIATMPPAPGGVARWCCWPAPRAPKLIAETHQVVWPTLRRDSDRPPPFINPSAIEDMAKAIALSSRMIQRDGRADPYYDPATALEYMKLANAVIDEAIQDDQARARHSLQQYGPQTKGVESAEYQQSHIPYWPGQFRG